MVAVWATGFYGRIADRRVLVSFSAVGSLFCNARLADGRTDPFGACHGSVRCSEAALGDRQKGRHEGKEKEGGALR